ncbi:MAG: lysine transporter LysE [Devosia sp.]
MTDPVLFFLAVLTILATPGPTNTLMATAGATAGISRSLPLLPAELSAYLIAILAIRIVLAPVIAAYPVIGVALKMAVAAYLVWLSIKLWRQKSSFGDNTRAVSFPNVFVTTLLNPKALILALTIFPREATGLVWYFVAFAVTVLAAGGGWIVLGRLLGAAAGERAVLLPRIASLALVGFAGFLLTSAMRLA